MLSVGCFCAASLPGLPSFDFCILGLVADLAIVTRISFSTSSKTSTPASRDSAICLIFVLSILPVDPSSFKNKNKMLALLWMFDIYFLDNSKVLPKCFCYGGHVSAFNCLFFHYSLKHDRMVFVVCCLLLCCSLCVFLTRNFFKVVFFRY